MILDRHPHTAVSYLLKRSYESIYARLKEVLSPVELSCFASAESRRTEQIWYSDREDKGVSYLTASEDDKNEISNLLEELKEAIIPKLLADSELSAIANMLFLIPSEECIWIFENADGSLSFTLCRWACRNAAGDRNNDPLSMVVRRPKPDHTAVSVLASYSDGSLYANMPVYFNYKDRIKSFKTNENGEVSLGLLKNGTNFSLAPSHSETPQTQQAFVVVAEQTKYHAVFPYHIALFIQVVNQKGVPVPGVNLNALYGSQSVSQSSDIEGKIHIPQLTFLPDDVPLTLLESDNPENSRTYTLTKQETNELEFEVFRPDYSQLIIKVIDQDNALVSNYPVNVETDRGKQAYQSDSGGVIRLDSLEVDKSVLITDGRDNANSQNATITEGQNEMLLKVVLPEPSIVQVKLVDHKDAPLPGMDMEFAFGTEVHKQTTDANGICHLSGDLFTDGQKVPVSIHIPKASGKSKTLRKSIKYVSTQSEYLIKLKKRRWLWWLLLLLLLPLLLIQCEKQVTIQVIDQETNAPVPNIDVNFAYTKYALYDSGRFLPADSLSFNATSDTDGMVTFGQLGTTIYAYLFKMNTLAYASARNDCYISEGKALKFHFMRAKRVEQLPIIPIYVPLDFLVVDKDDNEPIPDAKVVIVTELNGRRYLDSLATGADGKVLFSKIPKCGQLVYVRADMPGYYPDSITAKPIEAIAGGSVDAVRKLKLTPIKKKITFFVTNCNNGEPIPGAIATIYLSKVDTANAKKVYSNINGVGKGEYDDLHIINRIKIVVKKPYFKDGVWDKGLTVEEFIQLPDSLRVICLEPEDLDITFENIDSVTKKPLPGVKNIVSIKRGSTVRTDTVLSNKNGKFDVPGLNAGDKVSINASFEPNYNPNTTTVSNADVLELVKTPKKRIIPLKPKEIELIFRTIDPDADTLVNHANLEVLVDGKRVTNVTNSGNGTFKVKGYFNSTISIAAEKSGYVRNDSKIRNKAFNILATALQHERDIPLSIQRCNNSTSGNLSNKNYYLDEYQMGVSSGTFRFTYYTDSQPDTINVYCGPKNKINQNNLLFTYTGATGAARIDEYIKFNNCQIITVEVTGSSQWEYTVNCPN